MEIEREIKMTKWILPKETEERKKGIRKLMLEQQGVYNFSDATLSYLYNKGVRTLEDIDDMTEISLDSERNPLTLKDIDKATKAIAMHIERGNKIIVFGDYDTDGVTSVSIMVRALRNLGADVDYFVNDRFKHGFGINVQAIKDMIIEKGEPDLLITVDNGIVGYEGTDYATDKGIDVIITDHHIAEKTLPVASAVVNPHRLDDTTPFKDISGAAVAYKVMLALYLQEEKEFDYLYDMRDLVALSTVGDVMPLVDENRWFVSEGLDLIGRETRPQFVKLREAHQGNKPFNLDADLFGFLLSPMMNAPGRLIGKPDVAIDLFLTDDEAEMERLAKELVDLNEERKVLTASQVEIVEGIVDAEESNVIVAYHPEFHQGIMGLIAGRLAEKYKKPTIVFADGPNGTIKGSARTIPAYPIKDALDRINNHIMQYGGHDGAAGLTIKKSKLDDFRDALAKDAERLTADDLVAKVEVDALLKPSEITEELIAEISTLEPFGEGFKAPLFGMDTMPVKDVFYMTGGKHVKLMGDNGLSVLMFNGGEQVKEMGNIDIIQAVGTPSLNIWNGVTNVQFMVHNDCLIGK